MGAGAPRPRSSPGSFLAGPSPKRVSACTTMPTSRSRRRRTCGSWSPNATRRIRSMKPSTRRWSMLKLLPVRAGGGPGQGEVGEHPVGERDVGVLADDLQHPGAVALRPRPHRRGRGSPASRRRRAASASTWTTARWIWDATAAGTGPATGRPRRRPWPAPAPPPPGRPRRRAARSPGTAPRRGAGRSGPPPAPPACPAARTTRRVASSTSRSAAGLAIPRVTISSWITVRWVSSSSDGTPHSRGTPASSRRAPPRRSPRPPRPPAAAAPPAPPRSAPPWPAAARPGAAQRQVGRRRARRARSPGPLRWSSSMAANLRATTDSPADRTRPESLYTQGSLAHRACGRRPHRRPDSGRASAPSLSTGDQTGLPSSTGFDASALAFVAC